MRRCRHQTAAGLKCVSEKVACKSKIVLLCTLTRVPLVVYFCKHADTQTRRHAPTPHPDVCACGHGMSTSRHEGTTSLKTRSRRTILASIRRTQRRWTTCWRRSRSTRPGSSILSEQVGIWSWLQQLAILNTRAFGDLSCRKQHIVMRFYFLKKVLLYNRLRDTIRSFYTLKKKKDKEEARF